MPRPPEPTTPTDLERLLAEIDALSPQPSASEAAASAELAQVNTIAMAALGAALRRDPDTELKLLNELVGGHGYEGASHALHLLCSLAVRPVPHTGHQDCTVPARFDIEAVPTDLRSLWERAMAAATEVLSGTMTNNGVRVATGLSQFKDDLLVPTLLVVVSHVRQVFELIAEIQGEAVVMLDHLHSATDENES
jgi:hypothetical protein